MKHSVSVLVSERERTMCAGRLSCVQALSLGLLFPSANLSPPKSCWRITQPTPLQQSKDSVSYSHHSYDRCSYDPPAFQTPFPQLRTVNLTGVIE